MHALFLRNLTINPLILKVFALTKVGETSALTLPLKGREPIGVKGWLIR